MFFFWRLINWFELSILVNSFFYNSRLDCGHHYSISNWWWFSRVAWMSSFRIFFPDLWLTEYLREFRECFVIMHCVGWYELMVNFSVTAPRQEIKNADFFLSSILFTTKNWPRTPEFVLVTAIFSKNSKHAQARKEISLTLSCEIENFEV